MVLHLDVVLRVEVTLRDQVGVVWLPLEALAEPVVQVLLELRFLVDDQLRDVVVEPPQLVPEAVLVVVVVLLVPVRALGLVQAIVATVEVDPSCRCRPRLDRSSKCRRSREFCTASSRHSR